MLNLEQSNLLRIRRKPPVKPYYGLNVSIEAEKSRDAITYVLERGYDHWIINFSGGKDSTATVIVALETALENLTKVKRIDVIYADTMVEIPTIHQYALDFLKRLKQLDRLDPLPLYTHVAQPVVEQRFWARLLGKGYPPPHQKFRWCTKRLKIEPVKHKLKDVLRPNRTAIITGVRFNESKDRDKRLTQACSRGGECGAGLWFKYSSRLQAGYLAPIIDWGSCDVWTFLQLIAPDLGYSTIQLEDIYNGHETRFGCWMCTVVKQDKAMLKTIARPEWAHLKPMADFRNYVWQSTRRRNTRVMRPDDRPGKLRRHVRKKLLRKLRKIENTLGVELISEEEIKAIKNLWQEENHYG